MLTSAELYLNMGEEGPRTELEERFVNVQIRVGEAAVRDYCRRYISPMVWEDRFQLPRIVHLAEYPVMEILLVLADGHRVPENEYYFYPANGRLYRRSTNTPLDLPWGLAGWGFGMQIGTPDYLPEYYADWHGVGTLLVLYKAGYDPVPPVIKQIVSDYVYERVQLMRASVSTGGITPIPAGTVTGITIEGVGSIRYSGGATTTSSGVSSRAGSIPIVGTATALLDSYKEVASVSPGNRALISHRPALMIPLPEAPVLLSSDFPHDVFKYSDDDDSLLVYGDPGPGVIDEFRNQFPNGGYQPTTIHLTGSTVWASHWANVK